MEFYKKYSTKLWFLWFGFAIIYFTVFGMYKSLFCFILGCGCVGQGVRKYRENYNK